MMNGAQKDGKSQWSCVVCRQQVPGGHKKAVFAVGVCDHVVCYECSTRMRVLCKQNECAICRQDMAKVVFTSNRDKKFEEFDLSKCVHANNEHGIFFEDETCLDVFGRLLEHPCNKCKTRTFWNLNDLQTHLRKEHELFMCDTCVINLKIFSHERKYYTRKELSRHRRSGDPEETCHRGHPLCEFCDERFLDEDELQAHMRREHYYCHFCDPAGMSQFYGDYDSLRNHFRKQHFLCEECDCKEEKFTCAYNSEIDLQAHIAQFHSQHLSKTDRKKARTLSLDIFINSRAGASGSSFGNNERKKKNHKPPPQEEQESETTKKEEPPPPPPVPRPEDFPQLCSGSTQQSAPNNNFVLIKNSSKLGKKPTNTFSVCVSKNPSHISNKEEDFPSLVSRAKSDVHFPALPVHNNIKKKKPMKEKVNQPSLSNVLKEKLKLNESRSEKSFAANFQERKCTDQKESAPINNNNELLRNQPLNLSDNDEFPALKKQVKSTPAKLQNEPISLSSVVQELISSNDKDYTMTKND